MYLTFDEDLDVSFYHVSLLDVLMQSKMLQYVHAQHQKLASNNQAKLYWHHNKAYLEKSQLMPNNHRDDPIPQREMFWRPRCFFALASIIARFWSLLGQWCNKSLLSYGYLTMIHFNWRLDFCTLGSHRLYCCRICQYLNFKRLNVRMRKKNVNGQLVHVYQ